MSATSSSSGPARRSSKTPAASSLSDKKTVKPESEAEVTKSAAEGGGLQPGDVAPDFAAQTQDGKTVTLKGLRGKKVVLFFYPKDNTPGCTQEACQYRDDYSAFEKAGIVVLGISPDSAKSHGKFAEKFSLPFPLLADEEKKIVTAYGIWVEKSMYGRKYMGVERSTFLINEEGKVVKVMRKVHPSQHVSDILKAGTD